MSRIGLMPITLPQGVTVEQIAGMIEVKGQKGSLRIPMDPELTLEIKDKVARISDKSKRNMRVKAMHGLTRALLCNAVVGVSQGWEKTLELVGVGYRVTGSGSEVKLQVGFSHPVTVLAPQGITFTVKGNNKLTISGVSKKQVGDMAAKIRAIKPPEPYKGKGIRVLGEIVRKKAGKAVKTAV